MSRDIGPAWPLGDVERSILLAVEQVAHDARYWAGHGTSDCGVVVVPVDALEEILRRSTVLRGAGEVSA